MKIMKFTKHDVYQLYRCDQPGDQSGEYISAKYAKDIKELCGYFLASHRGMKPCYCRMCQAARRLMEE